MSSVSARPHVPVKCQCQTPCAVNLDTGDVEVVSVSSEGTLGNGVSGEGGAGVSADGRYVAFNDFLSYVDHVDLNPAGDPVANSYVLDRNTGIITLVTASDNGTPGVVPDYVMGETTMNDWGEISISGDGKRAVFTSIQYGMVDTNDFTIQCPNTPHMVYLRDCQPTDAGVPDSAERTRGSRLRPSVLPTLQ